MELSEDNKMYVIMADGVPYGWVDTMADAKQITEMWLDSMVAKNTSTEKKVKKISKGEGAVVKVKTLGTWYNDPWYKNVIQLDIIALPKILPRLKVSRVNVPLAPPLPGFYSY